METRQRVTPLRLNWEAHYRETALSSSCVPLLSTYRAAAAARKGSRASSWPSPAHAWGLRSPPFLGGYPTLWTASFPPPTPPNAIITLAGSTHPPSPSLLPLPPSLTLANSPGAPGTQTLELNPPTLPCSGEMWGRLGGPSAEHLRHDGSPGGIGTSCPTAPQSLSVGDVSWEHPEHPSTTGASCQGAVQGRSKIENG